MSPGCSSGKSQIFVPGDKATEDQLMDIVLDAGADDLRNLGDQWEILSDPASHEARAQGAGSQRYSPRGCDHRHGSQEPDQAGRQERRRHAAAAARRWKITTTCRASTPTSISTRRSWRRWRSKVRVLGIDCGSERTGYGVIDSDGPDHRMVAAGVICTSPEMAIREALAGDCDRLAELIREHAPGIRQRWKKSSMRPTPKRR